jgi:dihydrofolate reductase/thymidylate synthase
MSIESIPDKFRPLPERINVILSKNPNVRHDLQLPDSVVVAASLELAMEKLSSIEMDDKIGDVFVIGGGTVYADALKSKLCSKIYLTTIEAELDVDTFFPVVQANEFRLVSRSAPILESDLTFRFCEYERIPDDLVVPSSTLAKFQTMNSGVAMTPNLLSACNVNVEELQYLDSIRDIIENGSIRGDRTGTGTISKFGTQMRFSLRSNMFPLLTTKKVFWRGVAEELLWFVKGSTNANELAEKDIHIWDGNGSREFLDSRGLKDREVGDLGPVYGFQWRFFGAKYDNMHTNYSGQGIDQLKECIDKIKKTPEDRRIIMTAWNPSDLDIMALPPCHMFCQFYVANGELSCQVYYYTFKQIYIHYQSLIINLYIHYTQMYQRSADMGLGVPFNIASYSLLTVMMAQVCGLKAGDFVHSIGDAHVYSNHVDALKTQLQRTPKLFPKLFLNQDVKDIDQFTMSDFTIEGYNPDSTIKMKMAV